MAHIYVDIDIEEHLDELDNKTLIDELIDRDLDDEEVSVLLESSGLCWNKNNFSIIDSIKFNLINKGMNTKTLEELELFFK
tara:strand:- start:1849 stop:2091 length:243 start_codon:yes stop_codon:yes gene_type:complete